MLLINRLDIKQVEKAVNMLKVIAHPVRLTIVDLLNQEKKLTLTDIQQTLNIEQAVASQHISLMTDKGVLTCEKIGRHKYISLKYPKMQNIVSCIEGCCHEL